MGRKKKGELIDTTPEGILKRGDKLHYWLEQRDYPRRGSDTWNENLTNMDKVIIMQIERAMEKGGGDFTNLMEQAFGRNTEGADISHKEGGIKVDFGLNGEEDSY